MVADDFTAFDRLGGLVIVLDRQGTIVHWNRACAELFALTLDDVRGKPLGQILAPAGDAPAVQKALQAVQSGGACREFTCIWPGEGRQIAFAASLWPDTGAGPPLILLTGVDVTPGATHADATLTPLPALLEQAPDGFFVADHNGRYTDVNEAGCRLLGYTRAEIIGKSIIDLIPPREKDRMAHQRQLLLQGQVVVSEWTLRAKDGRWIPVEISAKILPGGTWQGFVRDISKRRRLELELAESRAELVRAQSVAKVGSWRLNIQRNELVWSAETHRIFGTPPGKPMTYDAFLARVHPDDRAGVDQRWAAALRGEPYDLEHRIVVGENIKWVHEKADLAFDEHGTLLGGIGIVKDITELKQSQQQARQSQERYELALRGAELGAWDWNIQTGEVIVNARWAELRGYRLDEIRPHVETWLAGVHPDDRPQIEQAIQDHFQGLTPDFETEHRVLTKSGAWIWVLGRGRVFSRDEQGHPIRMVGTELDVTARRRADEALRLAEAKATGILAISADAIISIDEDQRITLFNKGAETIFGYTAAEAIGESLDMLLPEGLRAVHRQHVARFTASPDLARHMGAQGVRICGLRKNGETFPADAAISKLDVGGKRILTVALRDVTEQERWENGQKFLAEVGTALARSLDFEETLTNIAQLVVRDIADVCIVDIVDELGELRRLKVACREPSIGGPCDLFTALPLDRSRPHLMLSALETKQPVLMARLTPETLTSLSQSEAHLQVLTAIGPTSLIAVPLMAHGKLLGAIALLSQSPGREFGPPDVRLAAQLARSAASALENAQLYRAANRAIQARDDLMGIVAHDLRNPLGIIIMQAKIMQGIGAEAGQRPVEAIERAATRMNRLIQDLLDVTRIEAGRLSLDQSSIPTGQLLADVLETQNPLAKSANLDLLLDAPADLPAVWADRHRLYQVFENLIGNAVKFTESGGQITIGAAARPNEVEFFVRDTGPGIAAEDIPHLFDRFWQAPSAKQLGAGLGLPIVKGIVEAHRGRIWVESTPGLGSTFFFTIPTAARTDQAA